MGAAVVAGEAHDDEVAEVGHAGLAHPGLAGHLAGVTERLENGGLLVHEVALLEGLREVQLRADLLGLDGELLFLCVLGTVAHLDELVHRPLEASHLQVFIDFGSEWIFDVGVATRIAYLDCEWEPLAIDVLLDPVQKCLKLLVLLWLMNFPKRLVEVEFLVGAEQVALDRVDFCLAVGGNFQIDLLKMNDRVLRLDEFPVEVTFAEHSEQDVDAEIVELASEVAFVVAEAALLAGEGGDHDLSEEGDLGEEDGSEASLLAVYAHRLDVVGWVKRELRYSTFLISAKMTSGAFFFCIVDDYNPI